MVNSIYKYSLPDGRCRHYEHDGLAHPVIRGYAQKLVKHFRLTAPPGEEQTVEVNIHWIHAVEGYLAETSATSIEVEIPNDPLIGDDRRRWFDAQLSKIPLEFQGVALTLAEKFAEQDATKPDSITHHLVKTVKTMRKACEEYSSRILQEAIEHHVQCLERAGKGSGPA